MESVSEKISSPTGTRVFVVHGHNQEVKREVEHFLRSLALDPIILDMEPNLGRTVIEKLEECGGDAVFAVVILTPDDCGRAAAERKLKPRARQNVIFELGFLWLIWAGRAWLLCILKGLSYRAIFSAFYTSP